MLTCLHPGFIVFLCSCLLHSYAQEKTDPWLKGLITGQASPQLQHILNHPDSFHYQLIYTVIDRDKSNRPHFKNHYLHVDANQYFNPASTVKLPTALMALEKINGYRKPGVNKYSSMLTDSSFSSQAAVRTDSSSANGYPSIAHYVKKIFLVSDNDAYNRLYEFTGQKELNEGLWRKGYKGTRIVRRFVTMTEEENRHTNAIRFMENDSVLLKQPAAYSDLSFDYSKNILVGKAHYNRQDSLIAAPMDFTRHNNLPLEDLQQMLQSVMFPQSVPGSRRFHLTSDDYRFLWQYMSQYPSESSWPRYDSNEFFDSYTKFFLFKAGKQKIPGHIRIFNKTGWSYGYLADAAYIVDFKNNIEFMLCAVIYVNRDGVLNDNKYEYEETGYPFFKELGDIIYRYELQRKKQFAPNLNQFRINYSKN